MTNVTDFPFPSSSHGWTPIELFDHEANYAAQPFLVHLPDGRWNEAWIDADDGESFVGEWRFVEVPGKPEESSRIQRMEPIAFMVITPPNLDELKQIVERKAA